MAFTYFFRDLHTLELLAERVVADFSGCRRIRVWDAGCAMGPEPYTLAMVFAERMGRFAFKNLTIEASDIDNSDLFGATIGAGVYSAEELRRIPPELFSKYFEAADAEGTFRISEQLRAKVHFQKHDLLSMAPIGDGFQLIVCKNVLLHFHPDDRVRVIKMFHRSLVPGGYFGSEQTQKLPQEVAHLFEQVASEVQVFRKRAGDEDSAS